MNSASPDDLIIFEDEKVAAFYPLTLSRPASCLLAGTRSNFRRITGYFNEFKIIMLCRPHLRGLFGGIQQDALHALQNNPPGRVILINGRAVFTNDDAGLVEDLKKNERFTVYVNNGDLVAATIPGPQFREIDLDPLSFGRAGGQAEIIGRAQARNPVETFMFSSIWQIVQRNQEMIALDYATYYGSGRSDDSRADAFIYNRPDVFEGDNVRIDAGSVVDAREGPVIIEDGAEIKPFTYLKGPAFIGKNCMLVGGKITEGCSIGEGSRIGGEVQNTLVMGNSNKYHDGFIGHAYLGEWVNLGALTTNSDLANNYAEIRIKQNGVVTKTGQMKVGSFIGDHTKIGIGVTLNTGCVIGFSCNLFGGTLILEKEVPSFGWGNDAIRHPFQLGKAIETAKIVLGRRNCQFTGFHQKLFEDIHKDSQELRDNWRAKNTPKA
jgi:UDP-N-acetylglucosamine diphosphorylase/glucosamine-1-phosphate N-acetyltransferase